MHRIRPLAAALAALLPALACAGEAITIYSSAPPGTLDARRLAEGADSAAIPGYAVVREDRRFPLAGGANMLRVDDVPALIDPTTVSFESLTDPAGTRVVEQSFEFDLAGSAKLLSRYLGREIAVDVPRGGGVETIQGTLLGTQGGLLLQQADGGVRIVPGYSGIRLPGLPGGLVSKPALVWQLDAAHSGIHRTRFSYQTGGMTWWADYNLAYSEPSPGGCRVDVAAWVTLVNQSGASFRDARVKLVAGDVHRAAVRGYALPEAPALSRMEAKKSEGFAEKAFFEYHLYTLGRATSLAQNSAKQIELFPKAPGVACEKKLVYQGEAPTWAYAGSPVLDRSYGVSTNRKVDVYLRIRNSQANGLGVPLPAGRVRVSRVDEADGAPEFIGEDVIDHTPRDETLQLALGSAFDVVGERRQLDFRVDSAARWMEEDIEVRVRNRKPSESVAVVVREPLYRWSSWTIVRRSLDFTREDARTIDFPVRIAPNGEAVVRYTVRYTW
ncbi:MAG TPA: hypothetical protein VLY46_14520 [Usitatibacter sp.]|nr:hypothetical protein [Usitatibacter sp.]